MGREAGESGRAFRPWCEWPQVKERRKIEWKNLKLSCIYFYEKSGKVIMQSLNQICPSEDPESPRNGPASITMLGFLISYTPPHWKHRLTGWWITTQQSGPWVSYVPCSYTDMFSWSLQILFNADPWANHVIQKRQKGTKNRTILHIG